MKKIRMHIVLCVCVIAILSFVGCSTKKVTAPATKATTANTVPTLNASRIDQVKSLMKQLSSEKQVEGSQIYMEKNVRYTVITFRKDADSKNAKEFATKYANLIEKAYDDKNANVKIVQNGKDIANVILK